MLIYMNENFTKKQFLIHVEKSIFHFKEKQVCAESRVALIAENSYAYAVALFSLIALKSSIVLIDNGLSDQEKKRILNLCSPDVILTEDTLHTMVDLSNTPMELSEHKRISKSDIISSEWLEKEDSFILFTSGSSGESKGVAKNGLLFLENIKVSMDEMNYNQKDVLLPLLPFSHFYGLSLLFIWWLAECKMVICNYKQVRSVFKAIKNFNVTVIDAVPATYYVMLELFKRSKRFKDILLHSHIRLWCIGGSPLSNKLAQDFFHETNSHLLDGYGLTELGNVALNTGDYQTGCGKPLPGITIEIRDDVGSVLKHDEIGEVWVKSRYAMDGYWNDLVRTQERFKDQWFQTNDLGRLDKLGNLFIIGRKDESFFRKGHVVYPASIEKSISDRLGLKTKVIQFEEIKKDSYLLLLIENGQAKESEQLLKKAVYHQIDEIYLPDQVLFVKEFPYLPNGKIDLKKLYYLTKKWYETEVFSKKY